MPGGAPRQRRCGRHGCLTTPAPASGLSPSTTSHSRVPQFTRCARSLTDYFDSLSRGGEGSVMGGRGRARRTVEDQGKKGSETPIDILKRFQAALGGVDLSLMLRSATVLELYVPCSELVLFSIE